MFATAIRVHLGAGGMALLATHIDLGLDQADTLDLSPFKAILTPLSDMDEALT